MPSRAKPCSAELSCDTVPPESGCLGLNPALEGAAVWGHGDMGTGTGAQGQGHRDTAQGDRHGDTEGDTAMGTQGDVAMGLGDEQGANEGQGAASRELWGWGPPGLGLWSTGTWGDAGLWGRDTGLWGCPEVSLSLWGPFPVGLGAEMCPPRAFLEGMSGTRMWGSGASVSGAGGLWGGMPGRAQLLQGHQFAAFCPRNGIGLPWGHGGVPTAGSWAQSPAPQLALAGRTHLIKSCPLG